MKTVSSSELAELLKLTPQRVNQLAKEGVFKRDPDGKFDASESIEIFYLRKFKTDDDINYDTEHALYERAKRERAELDLQVYKNELLVADDVEKLMTGIILTFKSRLLSLPTKCAPKVLGKKELPQVVDILQDAVSEALNELKEIPAAKVVDADAADT